MNYYQILEIPTTATQEEIKKAFRTQAKKYHPDINRDENAVEMMTKINLAYETLSDVNKRKEYDQKLKLQNEQSYHSYKSSREESEQDLEPWLKEYLLHRRYLDYLYKEYVSVETKIINLSKNYIKPSEEVQLKADWLLEEISKTMRSFVGKENENPILIFEFLLNELKDPTDNIAYGQNNYCFSDPKQAIIQDLILIEIKVFLKKFTSPENPCYIPFLTYILKKELALSDRITFMKRACLDIPASAQLIESILLGIIKDNKEKIKTIFEGSSNNKRKSHNNTN